MLEELAIQYINQTEDTLRLIAYGLVIAGAVLAGITWPSKAALSRAPYFAYSGAILLATASTQIVWLYSLPAVAGGYVWVFMAFDVIASLAAGFAFCIIAMARSRDAYGHGRLAALAFIPLANLWLLLTPPKKELDVNRIPTPPLVTGGVGVLVGFLALGGSIATQAFLAVESQRMVENAGQNEAALAASSTMAIRQFGLEAVVEQLAGEITEPMQIDDVTTLVRTEADGTTMRYIYLVDTEETELSASFIEGLQNHFCTYEPFIPVIREGGAIAASYFNTEAELIGAAESNAAVCGL